MTIDKNAMALFVKVVENLSFSRAAQKEGVPVSTVSRKIAALEKSLGVRLLERSTRALRTTEIGEEYYERCRRGLEEFDAANAVVTDRQTEVSGRLRISVPPSLSDILVIPLLNGFQREYPNVVVECFVTDRYVDHIADAVDLSLRVGDLADSSLVSRRLLSYRSILVASPDYLERHDPPRHPSDLALHSIVAFSTWGQKSIAWTLCKGDTRQRVRIAPRITLNDYAGVRQAVIDGMGVSEIPSIVCGEQLENDSLVEIMTAWKFRDVTIAAVYPSNKNLARVVRLFRDYCVERFADLLPFARSA